MIMGVGWLDTYQLLLVLISHCISTCHIKHISLIHIHNIYHLSFNNVLYNTFKVVLYIINVLLGTIQKTFLGVIEIFGGGSPRFAIHREGGGHILSIF